jgi:hypothetical protein
MVVESVQLRKIAYARSGDKGSNANIGVIAYTPEGFAFLKEHLVEEKVKEFFSALGAKTVKRYLLPNLDAINFVLEGVLAGGGSLSLRTDAQGKALGQAILEMTLAVPEEKLIAMLRDCNKNEGQIV